MVTGLSLVAWKLDVSGIDATHNTCTVNPKGSLLGTWTTDAIESYEHWIAACGGFWAATITLKVQMGELQSWFQDALGGHVEVYNAGVAKVWEGFIDSMIFDFGNVTYTVGPLLRAPNIVSPQYQILDASTRPPHTRGIRRAGPFANLSTADFQYPVEHWGYISRDLALEPMLNATGLTTAWTWADKHCLPRLSSEINLESPAAATIRVTLQCRGWVQRMNYFYTQMTATSTSSVTTKLAAILDADPNKLFSSANAELVTNASLVPVYENDRKRAWDIVKEYTLTNDTSRVLYSLGVYEDCKVIYALAPTEVEYAQSVGSNMAITYANDIPLDPSFVRPAKWLRIPDILVGSNPSDVVDLRRDPRLMYIEWVHYIAPSRVIISSDVNYWPAMTLGTWGLAGVGG